MGGRERESGREGESEGGGEGGREGGRGRESDFSVDTHKLYFVAYQKSTCIHAFTILCATTLLLALDLLTLACGAEGYCSRSVCVCGCVCGCLWVCLWVKGREKERRFGRAFVTPFPTSNPASM